MKAKDLLSTLISIENDLSVEYDKYCMGDMPPEVYRGISKKIIQKQIDLINEFKKENCKKYREALEFYIRYSRDSRNFGLITTKVNEALKN